MDDLSRFYIFTGKGGVGKSTLSLSFSKYLKNQNKNVKLVFFKTSKLDEGSLQYNVLLKEANELGVQVLDLDLLECAQGYIARKLNSKTIASWIIKTPFFKSLINMIPGFNYVIYLGQILTMLEDDPSLVLVLDSPSSGHALTMLQATTNFSEIFKSGAIFDDTKLMLSRMRQENFVKINVITIPTTLSLQEARELKQQINQDFQYKIDICCNFTLKDYANEELPEFLKKKIANEVEAIGQNQAELSVTINLVLTEDNTSLIKELVPSMKSLV